MSIKTIILGLFTLCLVGCNTPNGLNIKGGHSHNDYYHSKPLMDAIYNKMVSIEADVFPLNNQLLIAHSFDEVEEGKTLDNLYLKPLFELYKNKQLDTIILMIDIKTQGEESYQILKDKILPYKEMLSAFKRNKINKNHVSIVLSGERPKSILKEESRYVALDGRIDSISFRYDYSYYPLISDDWKKHFAWNGEGEIPKSELSKLKQLVKKCHQQNKMLRFWNIPGKASHAEPFWKLFLEQGVDLIGVDDPKEYYNLYLVTMGR